VFRFESSTESIIIHTGTTFKKCSGIGKILECLDMLPEQYVEQKRKKVFRYYKIVPVCNNNFVPIIAF
jgi:hypothetical protein